MNSEISRDFFLNIPFVLKVFMYSLAFASLFFFVLGFKGKFAVVHLFRELKCKFAPSLTIQYVSKKVFRRPALAVFHSAAFVGISFLFIATLFAAIHADTPFKVFKGTAYAVISFFADVGGVLLFLALLVNLVRRINLQVFTRIDAAMFVLLNVLIITGYILEGLRIAILSTGYLERLVSPVGVFFAYFFSRIFSLENIANLIPVLWTGHILCAFIIIAILPYTKLIHLVTFPFLSFFSSKEDCYFTKIDFSKAESDYYGLKKKLELLPLDVLRLNSCIQCGACSIVCPAYNSLKSLNPRAIISKVQKNSEYWEPEVFSDSELDGCTTCGACAQECPAGISPLSVISQLKQYKMLTLGRIPHNSFGVLNNVLRHQTPWGIGKDERFLWAEKYQFSIASKNKPVDFLFFIGCAGNIDSKNQRAIVDTVEVLKRNSLNVAFLGEAEFCCGDPLRRLGDEYNFQEMVKKNVKTLQQFSFNTILTACPHCLYVLEKEYFQVTGVRLNVKHHSELICSVSHNGLKKSINNDTVFIHDPCYLGRHRGSYTPLRQALKRANYRVKEFSSSKEDSLCCGMGGGNMWYESTEGSSCLNLRLKEIKKSKASIVATACPYCSISFDSIAKGKDSLFITKDIASLVRDSYVE